jgi:hypothetical protein
MPRQLSRLLAKAPWVNENQKTVRMGYAVLMPPLVYSSMTALSFLNKKM